jgi:hypothetical protein
MLFQASRAVTASSEMSRFISVSEYVPPSPSLLILACVETLGANSGANQQPARVLELTRIRQEGLAPLAAGIGNTNSMIQSRSPGPLNLL